MEAFSLLKHWRLGSNNGVNKTTEKQQLQPITTTIATTVNEMNVQQEEEEDEDGPFFDLEFAVPHEENEEEDEEDEGGFDFTVSSPDSSVSSGGNQVDFSSAPNNLTFSSPSNDIFFNGVPPLLLQSSPSSSTTSSSSVENSTNPKVQFPVCLIKTATKIRVFMLGFKSKTKTEDQNRVQTDQKLSTIKTEQKQSKKFVTVKFRVEEILPVISLFTRDSSSNNKIISSEEKIEEDEEKKLITKDFVQKYLKIIKPLYVGVSKRYNNGGSPFSPSRSMLSSANGLRIVRKHSGKTPSASSSVNPVTVTPNSPLLQEEDGIQSAILHCKRSFNASRDTDECASPSSREQSHEISIDPTRNSIDEAKK